VLRQVRQERAEQTREALLGAAAAEFDRNGYHGTSLSRVCKNAGVTMGALTFHFPTKAELADAVQESGCRTTTRILGDYQRTAPGLPTAAALTDTLVDLLQREPIIRAAARLSRERPDDSPDWYATWLPTLEHSLPRDPAGPASLAALVRYLITGAESALRQATDRHTTTHGADAHHATTRRHLAWFWTAIATNDSNTTADTH
jgi:AcrR family transcriptional regulator